MIDTWIIPKTRSRRDLFAIKDRQPMSEINTTVLPAVVWKDVSKVYENGYTALRKVSLRVHQGEILALLGTSGSGKTTLLKMVHRLIEPSSGEVVVRDQPTIEWSPIALRRSIGYVIQEGGLMPHLSVLENVALAAKVQGRGRAERHELATSRLELVGLDPARFGSSSPRQLGVRRRYRLGVARA